MAITFVNFSTAVALTTTGSPSYPASLAANDLIFLYAASDQSGISSSAAISAGFTALVAPTTGGNCTIAAWVKTASGSETGTIAVSVTSGTKGVAYMAAYRPDSGYAITPTYTTGIDSVVDSNFTATGSSWSTATNDMVICSIFHTTSTGTYSAGDTGTTNALSQVGATYTDTGRFAGRTGTNTAYYNLNDAVVSSGGTGAPTWGTATVATSTSANATGQALFVRLTEALSGGSSTITWTHSITVGG